MSATVPSAILSEKDFRSVCDEIYRKIGVYFEDCKLSFIQKRLEKRMALLGLETFDEYSFLLRFQDKDGREMQELTNLVTTNETYMFREFDQLQAFAEHCLPQVLKAKEAKGDSSLRIWSAGCSSGEEPYTLAMILREVMYDFDRWKVEIVATDIDEVRLRMAQRAVYDERAVKEVPAEYLARHISQLSGGGYAVRPETARCVEFRHLNLWDRLAMRRMQGFDFVFCRNVLIYFDDKSRRTVVDNFYNSLVPGGFIFLGHAESVGRITTAFQLLRAGKHLVYRK